VGKSPEKGGCLFLLLALKTNPLANKELEDFKKVYQPGKFAIKFAKCC